MSFQTKNFQTPTAQDSKSFLFLSNSFALYHFYNWLISLLTIYMFIYLSSLSYLFATQADDRGEKNKKAGTQMDGL